LDDGEGKEDDNVEMKDWGSSAGLGANLRPKCGSWAPRGSNEVEAEILDALFTPDKFKTQHSAKDVEIKELLAGLKEKDVVSAPTNKTNSFCVVAVDDCKGQALQHLSEREKEIPRAALASTVEQSLELSEPVLVSGWGTVMSWPRSSTSLVPETVQKVSFAFFVQNLSRASSRAAVLLPVRARMDGAVSS